MQAARGLVWRRPSQRRSQTGRAWRRAWTGCSRSFSVGLFANGSPDVTTAAGNVYTFGDGSGTPVSVRLTNATAQRAVLLDPELRLGEAYMDGSLVVERGSIADLLEILFSAGTYRGADLGVAAAGDPPLVPPRAAIQPALTLTAERRAPLRSRRAALPALPRRRSAIQLRLFRVEPSVARRRPARQEAPPRREAACRARGDGARHRLRLGRPRALPRRDRRGARHRHHAVEGAARARDRARRGARLQASVQASGSQDYRDVGGTLRPHRLGRHVRARRRRLLRHLFPQMRASFSPTTASCSCTRSAAASSPAVTNPWIAKYIFPGGYIPAFGGAAGDRARADCSSPTSRSCGCTMPRRSRPGAHASSPTARRPSGSTTSASCACGSSISRLPRWPSASSDMMVFQIQMAKRKGVVPLTRDYIGQEEARLRALEAGHSRAAATRRRITAARERRNTPSSADCATGRLLTLRRWVAGKAAMSISHARPARLSTTRSWLSATVADPARAPVD